MPKRPLSDYDVVLMHRETGAIAAKWEPRKPETDGPVIDALCDRLRARGIGFAKSENHVIADLRAVWQELLHDLKTQLIR